MINLLPSVEEAVSASLSIDSHLTSFASVIKQRYLNLLDWLQKIEKSGGIENFTKGYEYFGFLIKQHSIIYREWAPGAKAAYLIGDFNNWNRTSHAMSKDEFGVWSIELHDIEGKKAIEHNSKVKISMIDSEGRQFDRIPAWIHRAISSEFNVVYEGIFWNPEAPYKWKYKSPKNIPIDLRIYEAHVGIASPEGKIASYQEFTKNVLPRIAYLGYNCIQLMAIMEHAYYASFGYQVTNFFAISSRFGTPEELKELIDEAHKLNIIVLLDVVHSHASKNVLDGLNQFDGTDHCYFHEGKKGCHELWDSRLFNYGSFEVLRFLLSNLRYYIEEFQFDGFRFDGVTSMLYKHHGCSYGFSGDYHEYFGDSVDNESVAYFMLANYFLHWFYPNTVTIAEDVSGMPTLCRPVSEGGLGFDYRLGMATPDMWIKYLKEFPDNDWNMGKISFSLTNRRWEEKTITYCESHDQALVGDKTIAFWLMDKEMYDFMSVTSPLTPIIDRGLALHKTIRLITYGLGGEGYLNFMGNEFGHPEWLDFPRIGNGESYHYCRRQYNLIDDEMLRYKFLYEFDRAMHQVEERTKWLRSPNYVNLKHEDDKMIVFERKNLLFVINFHPRKSFADYRIRVSKGGKYRLTLDSDEKRFGGHGRLDSSVEHFTDSAEGNNYIWVYSPSRTGLVFELQE